MSSRRAGTKKRLRPEGKETDTANVHASGAFETLSLSSPASRAGGIPPSVLSNCNNSVPRHIPAKIIIKKADRRPSPAAFAATTMLKHGSLAAP
jgi:hypothetical protein